MPNIFVDCRCVPALSNYFPDLLLFAPNDLLNYCDETLSIRTISRYGFDVIFLCAHAEPLAIELEAFKVTHGENGAEVLVLAEEAAPGDLIEYRATYRNNTDRNLHELTPEIPIPDGLTFLRKSDQPSAATAVLIGGERVAAPFLQDAAGEAIPADVIRALQWRVPVLTAGETLVLRLRATVNP